MKYDIGALPESLQTAFREVGYFREGKEITLCAVRGADGAWQEGDRLTVSFTSRATFLHTLFAFDSGMDVSRMHKKFDSLGVLLDLSRNAVRTLPTLKKFLSMLVLLDYDAVQLYMEDTFEVPEEPYFGYRRGRYSQAELRELVSFGRSIGMECIPAIQTLAHLEGIGRWECYRPFMDTPNILLVDDERTYSLIGRMLSSLRGCGFSDKINLGMDEAHLIGLGKYLQQNGYRDRVSLMVRHLQRVCEIAASNGFASPMIWNDMLLRLACGVYEQAKRAPEVCEKLPEQLTLIGWNYYSTDRAFHENMLRVQHSFGRKVCYAGGANCWHGVTPQNAFAYEQTRAAMEACFATNTRRFLMTLWGDDGAECSPFASLPVLSHAAGLAYGAEDAYKGFFALTGIRQEDFCALGLANEACARGEAIVNPSRYMLYNDVLCGLMDCTVSEGDASKYRGYAAQLRKHERNPAWGYLFATQRRLCELLALKYDFGVRLRRAYHAGERALLRMYADELIVLKRKVGAFYEALRRQWYAENKGYGFEIQDYRLGGLLMRIEDVRRRILEYCSGGAERIEEAEEPVLNVFCDASLDGKGLGIHDFHKVASANKF